MPGHFAHVMLVDSICSNRLEEIPNLSPSIRSALQNYTPYCKLGAVSPDCPSCVGQDDASGWGKLMHFTRPADFVRYAIPYVFELSFNRSETRACIAWMFGYTAHLVADYTVHPVVKCLVGDYAKNASAHRLCEFNQDVYVVLQQTGKELVGSDCLELCGMKECADRSAKNTSLKAVIELWSHCLKEYPRPDTKPFVSLPKRSLDPSVWIATYLAMMKLATRGRALVRLLGLAYMKSEAILKRNIENLPTPDPTKRIHYDKLFEKTQQNIIAVWTQLAAALDAGDVAQKSGPHCSDHETQKLS